MVQLPIIDPTTAADESDAFTLEAGEVVKIGAYSALETDEVPARGFAIKELTPGAPNFIGWLEGKKSTLVEGPGSFKVIKPATTAAFGVYKSA